MFWKGLSRKVIFQEESYKVLCSIVLTSCMI